MDEFCHPFGVSLTIVALVCYKNFIPSGLLSNLLGRTYAMYFEFPVFDLIR